MESIIVEVNEESAKAWNNSSPELRAVYKAKINEMLTELQENETGFTEEQLKIINQDAGGERYEWWNDKKIVAELEQISADMDSGKDKGFTIEESRARLKLMLKKNG